MQHKSLGGMSWAYETLQIHDLDCVETMVVLHLGWKDAPKLRSVRGIARALNQHKTTIGRAVQRLKAKGVLTIRSGVLVPVAVVNLIEEGCPRSRDKAEIECPRSRDTGVHAHGTKVSTLTGHIEKEKERDSAEPRRVPPVEERRAIAKSMGLAVIDQEEMQCPA